MRLVIYAPVDPRDGRIRYVGKAVDLKRRLQNHFCPAALAKDCHRTRWLRVLREEGMLPAVRVLEVVQVRDALDEAECRWIAALRAGGCDLTNTTAGGEGGATYGRRGKPWSAAQRERYRATRLGKSVAAPSADGLLRRGAAIKAAWARRKAEGRGSWGHQSVEARAKISRAWKLRGQTPAQLAAALIGLQKAHAVLAAKRSRAPQLTLWREEVRNG